jgi:hypothetical protein
MRKGKISKAEKWVGCLMDGCAKKVRNNPQVEYCKSCQRGIDERMKVLSEKVRKKPSVGKNKRMKDSSDGVDPLRFRWKDKKGRRQSG